MGTAVVAALGDRTTVAPRGREPPVDHEPASVAGLYARLGHDAVVHGGQDATARRRSRRRTSGWPAWTSCSARSNGPPACPTARRFVHAGVGILSVEPVLTSAVASTVDGGIDAFVRSAAIELPRGLRINTVSATVFEEAWDAYGAMFPDATPIPVADAARAYVESLEGDATGQVFRVGY